jgi:hypothetical protein
VRKVPGGLARAAKLAALRRCRILRPMFLIEPKGKPTTHLGG